jgi:hypothetical protein
MPLWSNIDANTSAPRYTVASGLGVAANGSQMYANTSPNAFVNGARLGVFGVDANEIRLANNRAQAATHSGWILRREGTGGRAGRITTEVLVAMGSMSADADLTANDNTVFANT